MFETKQDKSFNELIDNETITSTEDPLPEEPQP